MKQLFALFSLFVWVLPSTAFAQVRDGISTGKDLVYGEDGVDLLYTHTSGVHLIAHSQGAGIGAHYGLFLRRWPSFGQILPHYSPVNRIP